MPKRIVQDAMTSRLPLMLESARAISGNQAVASARLFVNKRAAPLSTRANPLYPSNLISYRKSGESNGAYDRSGARMGRGTSVTASFCGGRALRWCYMLNNGIFGTGVATAQYCICTKEIQLRARKTASDAQRLLWQTKRGRP